MSSVPAGRGPSAHRRSAPYPLRRYPSSQSRRLPSPPPGAPSARLFVNPRLSPARPPEKDRRGSAAALGAITAWSEYAPTELLELEALARELGLGRVFYKDEGSRLGLGSFKTLGGAYAVEREAARIVEAVTGKAPCSEALRAGAWRDALASTTFACASAGNHGRAVAWGSRRLGIRCVVFLHGGVSEAAASGIAALGAEVVRTAGNYEESVREASETARREGWTIVSDVSDPDYTVIPQDIMWGYGVLADEVVRQLAKASTGGEGGVGSGGPSGEGGDASSRPALPPLPPTHVFLQAGVGGLAAGVIPRLVDAYGLGPQMPRFIVVEPTEAACILESARAGRVTVVTGALDTEMVGLACGKPSFLPWPILSSCAHAFIAVSDETAREAVRLLGDGEAGPRPVSAGASGAAGLAALLLASSDEAWRVTLGLDASSRVLLIGSERRVGE